MKALTICQPYPYLICLPESDPRHKRVENRTWSTSYRGPLAIHAGKSRRWLSGYDDLDEEERLYMHFGYVVATAELVACYYARNLLMVETCLKRVLPDEHAWVASHIHTEGPWCWVLDNVRVLETPVPARGARGLWEWEGAS